MTLFSRFFLCLLLATTLLLAKVTGDPYHESYKASDASAWDVLEAIANTTTRSNQVYEHYQLWRLYRSSSKTKTLASMRNLDKALTHQEYVNSRIKMAAWLLFGPEKAQSNLLAVRSPHRLIDDLQCVESTVKSFIKHCGLLFLDGFMNRRWISNICRYAPNKQGIDEAVFASCVTRVTTSADNDYDEPSKASTNASTWEVLEAIANHTTSFHIPTALCFKDPQLYRLWGNSLRSKTPSLNILAKTLADKEYVSSRIKMAAIILFGPEKALSTLRSPRGRRVHCVDDLQCLRSTVKLFDDHCGFRSEHLSPHVTSFLNLCSHLDDKAAIKEAFMAACGMKNVEAYAVNVKNSTMKVIPTPMRGSSEYCERVSVNGESRVKLGSFSKIYRVLLHPSEPWGWHDQAQICVHRNASLGLCQCEKDDWRTLDNEVWSFVMSPYDTRFIDVKFSRGIEGYVTVSLYEGDMVNWKSIWEFIYHGIMKRN